MAEQAYAYVTLIPVAKGFQSAVAKELKGTGGEGGSAGKAAGSQFKSNFGGALKGIAAIAGTALAAAGVGKFVSDSIKQASDLGESLNAVSVVFEESAGGIEKLGEAASKSLGISQTDFNAAAVQFSSFAEKIAGDGGDVVGTIDDLTTRGADFASVMNLDVDQALGAFQSGLAGSTEPLKQYGIDLSAAAVETYALENGLVGVGETMTEEVKVQARYGALMEQTAKTAGDFANTSDSLANSQRILGASFSDAQATVGDAFLPAMANLSAAMVPLVDLIMPKFGALMNETVGPALENITERFKEFTTGIAEDGFSATVGDFFTSIGDQLSGEGLSALFEKMAEIRMQLFNGIIDALPGIIEGILAFLPELIRIITEEVLPTALEQMTLMATEILGVFQEAFPLIIEAFTEIIPDLITAIVDLLPPMIETILGMLPELMDTALTLFNALIEAVIEIAPQLIQSLIDLLPQLVTTIVDMLPEIIEAGIELFNGIITALIDVIPELLTAIIDAIPRITETLVDALPDIIEAGFELFTGLVEAVINATPEIVGAIIELIPEITGALIDAIPDLIDAGIELLKGLANGIIENGPRLLSEAVNSIGSFITDGFEDLLGIESPSKVFHGYGEDIGQGLANGVDSMTGLVADSSEALAEIANSTFGKTLEQLAGTTQEIIDNGTKIRATFSESGDLLSSYTTSEAGTQPAISDKGVVNFARVTNDLNSLYKYAGQTNINDLLDTQDMLFGGTFQQAIDQLNDQVTLINPETGQSRTIGGNLSQSYLDQVAAEGFTEALGQTSKTNEELIDAIGGLTEQVEQGGLTPFAKGGVVTGPTKALIGEAGPEMVIPLNKFENMLEAGSNKTLIYQAAPNQSMDSEQELFSAMRRAKVVANW